MIYAEWKKAYAKWKKEDRETWHKKMVRMW